jgi:hypothetical protein
LKIIKKKGKNMTPHSFKNILMISAVSLLPFVSMAGDLKERSVLETETPKKTESSVSKIVIDDQKTEVSNGSSIESETATAPSEENPVHYIFPEI